MAEAERTIGTPDTDTPQASGDEPGESLADGASRPAGTTRSPSDTARGPADASPVSLQQVEDGALPPAESPADEDRTRSGSTADVEEEQTVHQDGRRSPQDQQGQQDQQAQARPQGQEGQQGKEGQRKITVLFAVAGLAYLLDVISKVIVVAKLEHHEPVGLIGDWLRLDAIRNPGAAFGMGQAFTVIFTVIAAVVIFVIVRLARKLYSLPWAIALGLLLGGALGNLTDRLFRSPGVFKGAVVDFIAPRYFAVFNLADSAIVCGGILIVLLSFRGLDPDGSVHKD